MQPQKSFRSRKIDYRRALPVFRATELPDLDETANSRAIPVIATGVEKEEEEVSRDNKTKNEKKEVTASNLY